MFVICYLFCVCVCRLKAQQSLCLYVVLTMPTLNKTYLFIYLFIYLCIQTCLMVSIIIVFILIISLYIAFHNLQKRGVGVWFTWACGKYRYCLLIKHIDLNRRDHENVSINMVEFYA